MALNPIACTENVVRSFLRYQLTAYPFADPHLHSQMRKLLSLDETRQSPLLEGPYVSLSRPFRQGASVASLVAEGRTTLVSTGTGSGKTECFLLPNHQPLSRAPGRGGAARRQRRHRLSDETRSPKTSSCGCADRHHPQAGASMAGTVLVLPGTRAAPAAPARWPSAFGSAPVRPRLCCRPADRSVVIGVLVADELHGRPVPVLVVPRDAHASFRTGEVVTIAAGGGLRLRMVVPAHPARDDPVESGATMPLTSALCTMSQ